MNQYFYSKQNIAQWMTVVALYKLQSRMNLSIFQAIVVIELSSMLRAKGYNLEDIVKELNKKSNQTMVRADR